MSFAVVTPVAGTEQQANAPGELVRGGQASLLPSSKTGIFGRDMVFEDVRNRFDALITRVRASRRAGDSAIPSHHCPGARWKRLDISNRFRGYAAPCVGSLAGIGRPSMSPGAQAGAKNWSG